MLPLNDVLLELAGQSWAQAATKMTTFLDSIDANALAAEGVNSSSELLARFAAIRSITVNTARRHLSAAAFLKTAVSERDFDDVITRRCPPFNDVEYLKKIHDIAPEKAMSLVPHVIDRSISRTMLAERYRSAQHATPNKSHKIGIRKGFAIDFKRKILDSLRLTAHELYPVGLQTRIFPSPRQLEDFPFALPDAIVEVPGAEYPTYDAIEIRLHNEGAKHEVWQILERIHLMSTFFTMTWLFVPSPTTDEQANFTDRLIDAAEKLDMPSVGIVRCTFNPDPIFDVVHSPFGPPDIDRRHLFPLTKDWWKHSDDTPDERAKRNRRVARRERVVAPEAAPAPAGRAEGRGSRQLENAPAFSGALAPVIGGGRAPTVEAPQGRTTTQPAVDRPGRVVR